MQKLDLALNCTGCEINPENGKTVAVEVRGIDIGDMINQLDEKEIQQVVDEIFHNRYIEDYIPESKLQKWAEENGYVKE